MYSYVTWSCSRPITVGNEFSSSGCTLLRVVSLTPLSDSPSFLIKSYFTLNITYEVFTRCKTKKMWSFNKIITISTETEVHDYYQLCPGTVSYGQQHPLKQRTSISFYFILYLCTNTYIKRQVWFLVFLMDRALHASYTRKMGLQNNIK